MDGLLTGVFKNMRGLKAYALKRQVLERLQKMAGKNFRRCGCLFLPGVFQPSMAPVERKYKRDAGFTLLELLISITIFAVGILSVSSLFDNSYRADFSARSLNVANRVAQTTAEKLQTLGYATVLNNMPVANYSAAGNTLTNWENQTSNNITYTVTVRIDKSYAVSGPVTVDKALVTVSWTNLGGNRQVQLETFL